MDKGKQLPTREESGRPLPLEFGIRMVNLVLFCHIIPHNHYRARKKYL